MIRYKFIAALLPSELYVRVSCLVHSIMRGLSHLTTVWLRNGKIPSFQVEFAYIRQLQQADVRSVSYS